ncbi:hypothetical protein IMSAGC007_03743 [Lachnospiraceae bacterium]|nr:hypothetical protein IMSAGC007_03743 [Lachnospiraceae bacterium]
MKTALILDHRLEAVTDAELFMENAAAVVDMRSIVAMLNAKLIKILYATTLCTRFLAPCRNFFTNNQPFSKILMEVRACKPW